jgi:hypothetical protein
MALDPKRWFSERLRLAKLEGIMVLFRVKGLAMTGLSQDFRMGSSSMSG